MNKLELKHQIDSAFTNNKLVVINTQMGGGSITTLKDLYPSAIVIETANYLIGQLLDEIALHSGIIIVCDNGGWVNKYGCLLSLLDSESIGKLQIVLVKYGNSKPQVQFTHNKLVYIEFTLMPVNC